MLARKLIQWLGSMVSPARQRGKLSILIYHRVLPEQDPLMPSEVDASAFTWQMEVMKRFFNVLPLSEAIQRLEQNSLPARAACITFDDGYADNAEIALPILQQLQLPATFFVATAFLDGGRMWNDTIIEGVRRASGARLDLRELDLGEYAIGVLDKRRTAIGDLLPRLKHQPHEQRRALVERFEGLIGKQLPDDLMMRTDQVRQLADAGMEIGGHTVNHPILRTLGADAARSEIGRGKETLEGIIRQPVSVFAYPNGKPEKDYDISHVNIVKDCGFDAAVSTAWGVASGGADRYQLPRFTPWDQTPNRFLLRLYKNCTQTRFALSCP